MLVRIGGHSINPINVFAVEPIDICVETKVKTSNEKEVDKTEVVAGVCIMGLGNSVEVQGVTVEQVEDELNRAMAAAYVQPEREVTPNKGQIK